MSRTAIILLIGLAIFVANTIATELECTRENEEYQCGSACQTTCNNLGQFCPIVNVKCNDACYCKQGYARIQNDTGPCVSIESCPKEGESILENK
ncbi:PREDICTED: inducible metalloproteinase inhibitor protein [Wasmannia auropunctata]|uniref:inducible metalloproteinase inhibitor protein n=1 Tax=Wasmannia auropunctata TaxID=64793 RepID=UPI0005EE1068|nr:PREDICTED: inducible metalloproteinase inhibitor protein [Wasmannia auropunctata]